MPSDYGPFWISLNRNCAHGTTNHINVCLAPLVRRGKTSEQNKGTPVNTKNNNVIMRIRGAIVQVVRMTNENKGYVMHCMCITWTEDGWRHSLRLHWKSLDMRNRFSITESGQWISSVINWYYGFSINYHSDSFWEPMSPFSHERELEIALLGNK
jgi:hypothetical protein